jgi:hypothetical protein
MSSIYAFQVQIFLIEVLYKLNEVLLDQMPTFFQKSSIESLQGFRYIATKRFVAISTKLLQYVPIATKCLSLPPVATGSMVIGYCHKKMIVASKHAIATTLW